MGQECFEVGHEFHRGRWWLLASVHGRSHPARCEESEGAVYLSDRVWLVGAVGTGC